MRDDLEHLAQQLTKEQGEPLNGFINATIERVVRRYDSSRLYYSTFCWVEAAWLRLPEAQP